MLEPDETRIFGICQLIGQKLEVGRSIFQHIVLFEDGVIPKTNLWFKLESNYIICMLNVKMSTKIPANSSIQ